MGTPDPTEAAAAPAQAETLLQWTFAEKDSVPRVVQRNDGNRRTKLRLEPGDDCTEDGYHAERCDLHDGVDVDVLQLAKRGKERYARVRTLRCASGWIKTEYLVTRAAYERTV